MTPDQLTQMQKARAAAIQRRHRRERDEVKAYREWISAEARAYARLVRARLTREGVTEAQIHWKSTVKSMPKIPPDSAWKRDE